MVRKFFAEVGVKSLELYIDRSAQAAFKVNAVGLPATLLLDSDGREIGRHLGPAKWDSPRLVEDLRRRMQPGRGFHAGRRVRLRLQHARHDGLMLP